MIIMLTFRDWLRETIETLDIKQQALAQMVGVSQATISKWLNSDDESDKPRADLIMKLAEATHTDPKKLFNMVYGLPIDEVSPFTEQIERIMQKVEQLDEERQKQFEDYLDYLLHLERKERESRQYQKQVAAVPKSK